MKRISLALAQYSLSVFVGAKEYLSFRKRYMSVTGKWIPETPTKDGNEVGGIACLQNIWVQENRAPLLAHEALHALEIMYSHIGISSHPDHVDETKAYQLQYILERMGH